MIITVKTIFSADSEAFLGKVLADNDWSYKWPFCDIHLMTPSPSWSYEDTMENAMEF